MGIKFTTVARVPYQMRTKIAYTAEEIAHIVEVNGEKDCRKIAEAFDKACAGAKNGRVITFHMNSSLIENDRAMVHFNKVLKARRFGELKQEGPDKFSVIVKKSDEV